MADSLFDQHAPFLHRRETVTLNAAHQLGQPLTIVNSRTAHRVSNFIADTSWIGQTRNDREIPSSTLAHRNGLGLLLPTYTIYDPELLDEVTFAWPLLTVARTQVEASRGYFTVSRDLAELYLHFFLDRSFPQSWITENYSEAISLLDLCLRSLTC